MGQYIIRGVPASVLQDSWWLDDGADRPGREDGFLGPKRRLAGGALALLTALADVLFLDYEPGISLAVFAVAVAGVVWLLLRRTHAVIGPALLMLLSILPVVEYFQALSVAFLLGGSATALCWAVLGDHRGLAAALRRFIGLFPILAVWQAFVVLRDGQAATRETGARARIWRAWAFPTGGALVLGSLIVSANPLLSDWVDQIWRLNFQIDRVLFWIGAAIMIWPVLGVAAEPGLLAPKAGPARPRKSIEFGINAQSVSNALILFNLLLATQTIMDAVYLWGGAQLPDGMSYAEYAHRGAYPLVATALLAGAFALVARPYLGERVELKVLMMVWLGQNVLLVGSSVFRLSLYVEIYGLTYLRVHAAIWMALVALGLCLTAWQILNDKPIRWLLIRCAVLSMGVLYACCFVNFAAFIARENLRQPVRYDAYYVCQLGPMAAAEIAANMRESGCRMRPPVIANWRDWGFRKERVIRNLNAELNMESRNENPRRG
ncbi:MAG: DUF4153 domain-containing protein [Ruegeria sp.]